MLRIYDSLSKEKHEFIPIKPGHVALYVCGITVYDYCHIGHGRAYILFDMIVRYLRFRDYKVNYVRNITDIDDKIIQRANKNKETCDALTERFIKTMHEDFEALGALKPNAEPRATEYIPQIITLIEKIIEQGYAYVADNGDVYYSVRKFKAYGKLSHRKIEDLIAGARVELNDNKRDPVDFVLWKLAKPNEPQWDSPWGVGRPGWHIECSAMSTGLLGQPFDIHGGGMDLKFPHHENEIAQSEAARHTGFANLWMHIGLLQVSGEKMSKSLGNYFTIREVLEEYDVELIRYFMFSGHYRSPVNYSKENLAQLQSGLERLYLALRDLPVPGASDPESKPELEEKPEIKSAAAFKARFIDAMDDDFNTPLAISVLFEMAHEIQRLHESNDLIAAAKLGQVLVNLGALFGILQKDPSSFFQGDSDSDEIAKIDALIEERNLARSNKDWKKADEIRDALTAMGIAIEDASGTTVWRRIS